MSSSLDPDQARSLQRLSTDGDSGQEVKSVN